MPDTVNIKEIILNGVDVVLEQRGVSGNNLQDIIKAIPKSEEADDKTKKSSKKLHIEKLELNNITVKARDTRGLESEWSEPLVVKMPRDKSINNLFLRFLEKYPFLYQLLQLMLQRLGL